ncbi:MAG: helix-turn-helix transcriptional regulator [Oscillospiraceae bacterium]|nr:helix-turn-helix transcriptional regulator [Oscillospiraceae bacterium]
MEFKDNLKQLRKDKELTQAQLAEKLFVSRSTVAKWENGLGFPNPEAMATLEELFDTTAREIATKEPEAVIVAKNRRLRLVGQIVGWSAILALFVITSILPFAIHNGYYGFTPDMAAGGYSDEAYIDTGDYRIYYFTFEGDWEDGRHWSDLQGWKIVEKHFWGCTVSYESVQMHVITKDNYVVGQIYSIKGKNGYYNLLNKAGHYKFESAKQQIVWDIPEELICATSVTISAVEYELQDGFFFITQKPVEWFKIGDVWYDVIE